MSELKRTESGPTWVKALNKVDDTLFVVEKYFLLVIGILMTTATLVEVVLRYAFSATLLVGISELLNWAFVWLVLIGCASLVRIKRHMSVDYFLNKLSVRLRRVIVISTNFILIFFFVHVIATGFAFAFQQWRIKTTAANIPKTWLYLSVPVGMTLILIHLAIQSVRKVRGDE